MPLPKEPFSIHGGCDCRAVRYEVSVPAFSERPQTSYRNPGADIRDLRIPAIYMDHCNDCRRATGSILPMALVCDIRTVRISLLSRSVRGEGALEIADSGRKWDPAANLFVFGILLLENFYMTLYKSSPGRSRWFCSRCGTMVAYSVDPGVIPPEWKWPTMLDIWLGTVDREDLEKVYMSPERMLWCEIGVPWTRKLSHAGADGIPEHPLTKIDELVGEHVDEKSKESAGLDK